MYVCIDCVMFHANGELPEDEDRAEAVVSAVRDGEAVAIGDHAGFSWSRCDLCGDRLGGDRYEANVLTFA